MNIVRTQLRKKSLLVFAAATLAALPLSGIAGEFSGCRPLDNGPGRCCTGVTINDLQNTQFKKDCDANKGVLSLKPREAGGKCTIHLQSLEDQEGDTLTCNEVCANCAAKGNLNKPSDKIINISENVTNVIAEQSGSCKNVAKDRLSVIIAGVQAGREAGAAATSKDFISCAFNCYGKFPHLGVAPSKDGALNNLNSYLLCTGTYQQDQISKAERDCAEELLEDARTYQNFMDPNLGKSNSRRKAQLDQALEAAIKIGAETKPNFLGCSQRCQKLFPKAPGRYILKAEELQNMQLQTICTGDQYADGLGPDEQAYIHRKLSGHNTCMDYFNGTAIQERSPEEKQKRIELIKAASDKGIQAYKSGSFKGCSDTCLAAYPDGKSEKSPNYVGYEVCMGNEYAHHLDKDEQDFIRKLYRGKSTCMGYAEKTNNLTK